MKTLLIPNSTCYTSGNKTETRSGVISCALCADKQQRLYISGNTTGTPVRTPIPVEQYAKTKQNRPRQV